MKKLLLSCAVLVGLCAYAQDDPLYTAVGTAVAAGYEGYTDFIPTLPIPVEAYEDYVILKNWAGVEGYDLKVGFDEEEAVTSLGYSLNGELKYEATATGWTSWLYTGIPKADSNFYAVRSYIGSDYSNAYSDPEDLSGYVVIMFYSSSTDTEPNEYAYYYVTWGYSAGPQEVIGAEDNTTPWWSDWSDNLGMEGDGTIHYEFYNYSNCAENRDNWVLVLTNEPYSPNNGEIYTSAQELVVFRADAYGWGPLYTSSIMEHNYNWDTFKQDMNQAWVELDIVREGEKVEVHAATYTIDDKEYHYDITINGVKDEFLGSFLTVEGGHLEIYDAYIEEPAAISTVATDNMTPAVYYNLQGIMVNPSNLTNGVYIMRQGNEAKKVLIRK